MDQSIEVRRLGQQDLLVCAGSLIRPALAMQCECRLEIHQNGPPSVCSGHISCCIEVEGRGVRTERPPRTREDAVRDARQTKILSGSSVVLGGLRVVPGFLAARQYAMLSAQAKGALLMKVGFIGVGNMGGPMCRNIIRNTNHDVTVCDLNPAAIAACTELGATAGTSVAQVATDCDIVFTSLPMPRNVEEVAAGIAASAKPGTVYIDLSTNSPATARRVNEQMRAKGIQMLEAPVSGGTARATDGTIVIMVGGDTAVFDSQLPLLKSFSGEVVHVGEIGMGSVAKLVNNMLAFCNAAAAAEALMIGTMAGIDLHKLQQVISNASGNSSAFRNISDKAFKREFAATFALDLAHKDLRLALELADELGVPGMIAPQVMNLMRIARARGMGTDDSSSVIRVYEQALGREVKP
jgi:3-hydroxyisobutyrate dehydrogenase-like beta-hydroxyacid dehydrogenase